MTIDWQLELMLCMKVVLSFFAGAFIGWERERHGQEAGIRTFGLIALGSCVFGLISGHIAHADHGRIAAQIVSGIGFVCAGVIFRENGLIKGITTAATLWCTASVGLAVAFDMYIIGFVTTLIIVVFLSLGGTRFWGMVSNKAAPSKRRRPSIKE